MDLEQYTGCIIRYNGKVAVIKGARSNYDGEWFFLQYHGSDDVFGVNAFENGLLNALPDPRDGILKRTGNGVVFLLDGNEYVLGSHPYEPCLYMKKGGEIFRTLHNAFVTDELPERFARGELLTGIDGREYDLKSFCRALAAAVTSGRTEMDFSFAAVLSRTETERYGDMPGRTAENRLNAAEKPRIMNFCPECGRKNNGGRYCTACGTKLFRE